MVEWVPAATFLFQQQQQQWTQPPQQLSNQLTASIAAEHTLHRMLVELLLLPVLVLRLLIVC